MPGTNGILKVQTTRLATKESACHKSSLEWQEYASGCWVNTFCNFFFHSLPPSCWCLCWSIPPMDCFFNCAKDRATQFEHIHKPIYATQSSSLGTKAQIQHKQFHTRAELVDNISTHHLIVYHPPDTLRSFIFDFNEFATFLAFHNSFQHLPAAAICWACDRWCTQLLAHLLGLLRLKSVHAQFQLSNKPKECWGSTFILVIAKYFRILIGTL